MLTRNFSSLKSVEVAITTDLVEQMLDNAIGNTTVC